jgi:purine-binding chemotaxis protein CheW
MADSVHQVVDYTADQIQPAPSFGPRVRAGYLLGMASSTNAKFVLLLDINRIFSSDEIIAVAETPAEAWVDEQPANPAALSE